jgi:hypothetical protein
VLDRFRPRRDTGSAPYHYVLGPLGAAVLAAEQGIGVADLGYRRATTLAIAHHRRLPALVGGNGFFAALAGHARRHPDADLALWWSQRRCQATWGTLVQPHGFGRWQERGAVLDFFLVCDNADDAISRLTAALSGYEELARATPQLATVTLLWMTTLEREAQVRRALHPHGCVVATAPPAGGRSPAGGRAQPRRGGLAAARPNQAAPTAGRPRPSPLLDTGPTVNAAPSAAPAGCWNTDGPSRPRGERIGRSRASRCPCRRCSCSAAPNATPHRRRGGGRDDRSRPVARPAQPHRSGSQPRGAAGGMESRDPAPLAPPPAWTDLRPLAQALLAAALDACGNPLALPARPRSRGRPPYPDQEEAGRCAASPT